MKSKIWILWRPLLIVGVLSEALVIPVDEKRLLGIMEKMRLDKIHRHAAARVIQTIWRLYNFRRMTKLDIYTRSQAGVGMMSKMTTLFHVNLPTGTKNSNSFPSAFSKPTN